MRAGCKGPPSCGGTTPARRAREGLAVRVPVAAGADVFMLPLAVAVPEAVQNLGVDAWLLSRRVPDFLHQMINQGDAAPTAMVEVQTEAGTSPPQWVQFASPPPAEECFEMLPPGYVARALVVGTLSAAGEDLAVELRVYFTEDAGAGSTTLAAMVSCADPTAALARLAERVARVLDVSMPPPKGNLLTRSGPAFFAFLAGLEGAALLSGELDRADPSRPEELLRPLADAVRLDPTFGLALRTWHATVALALAHQRLDPQACAHLADQCLGALPRDGEACVAIAEQMALLGDDARATRWLQHAVELDPPPPRGLESLGIVLANRGEVDAARNLWVAGLEQDGHPDFFAHLARLAFACGDASDGWEKIVCGLRRVRERATRQQEWGDDQRGCGVLLSYLREHCAERRPPPSVGHALADLCGVLLCGDDRVELALCLIELGAATAGEAELAAGLAGELTPDIRDRAVRALLRLRVRNFEVRFARAVDSVTRARAARRALLELERFRRLEPAFWLATFYAGIAHRRLGDEEASLDLLAEVLRQRPGQPDALTEMAALFDRRGNPKRALECIEDALVARPGDVALLGRRALYQHRLGRTGPARESLHAAMFGGRATPELEEIRRQILS
jgi:tetratricopeptide (TPR) repeat protein